ncbi:hypothetical protein B0H19DRAFT_1129317 [Mycena capillaripes]|nr:hypothetical protein B0H19DRAFT_1129317 [Mycena capillaripes]
MFLITLPRACHWIISYKAVFATNPHLTMLSFTVILVSLSPLVFQSGTLGCCESSPHSSRSLLSIRQSSEPSDTYPIVSQCKTQCTTIENLLNNTASAVDFCTNAVASQIEACYDCESNAGVETIEFFQEKVNTLVAECANLGKPVKSVTVVAKNAGGRVSFGIPGSVALGLAALSLVAL